MIKTSAKNGDTWPAKFRFKIEQLRETRQAIIAGLLAGVSQELRKAYYSHGYQRDEDMPRLPCPPQEDEECIDLVEELYKKDIVRLIEAVLEDVTPRQKKVLCLRFGIGLTQEYTLEEIGAMFNLSRNRICQIEGKAIRYIKHPLRSDKLKELVTY